MTRTQYQNGSVAKPKNLFSHSDQTTLWNSQSARPDTAYGWAGRMADFVLPLNNGSALSPAITIAGQTRILRGQVVAPYAMTTSGTVTLTGMTGTDGARRLNAFQRVLGQTHGHAMERGKRYAVCDKTFQLYQQAPYREHFAFIEPRLSISPETAQPFDCHRTELRHPKETKGQDYNATTEAAHCRSGGDGADCC